MATADIECWDEQSEEQDDCGGSNREREASFSTPEFSSISECGVFALDEKVVDEFAS